MDVLILQLAISLKWVIVILTIGFTMCAVGWFYLFWDADEYKEKRKKRLKEGKVHSIFKKAE